MVDGVIKNCRLSKLLYYSVFGDKRVTRATAMINVYCWSAVKHHGWHIKNTWALLFCHAIEHIDWIWWYITLDNRYRIGSLFNRLSSQTTSIELDIWLFVTIWSLPIASQTSTLFRYNTRCVQNIICLNMIYFTIVASFSITKLCTNNCIYIYITHTIYVW